MTKIDKPMVISQIQDYFKSHEKKQQLIGLEAEKIGIKTLSWKPPVYTGKAGYLAILGKLHDELGWQITNQEGRYILEMNRGGTHLALESDGRIELASSPHTSIHDLAREFRIHQNEIKEISDIFGISWLGTGYHPFSLNREIKEMPGERKREIKKFYIERKKQTGNNYGMAFFKKTAGIHVNLDYSNEEDFSLKSKVLTRLTPVLNAMFANSPFSKRKFTGYMSYRRFIDINSNLARQSVSKELYESEFTYQNWIDEVLSFTAMFIKKGDEWIYPQKSFADYIDEGYENHKATWEDFETHMKTLWMGLRMRNVIELRCIDSLPPRLVPSVAALIKGISYDKNTLHEIDKKTQDWQYGEWMNLSNEAAKYGLKASIRNQKIIHLAKELIEIAEENLKKERIRDFKGRDESYYLNHIKEYLFMHGKSPAEWLVEKWLGEWNKNFQPIVEWYKY